MIAILFTTAESPRVSSSEGIYTYTHVYVSATGSLTYIYIPIEDHFPREITAWLFEYQRKIFASGTYNATPTRGESPVHSDS